MKQIPLEYLSLTDLPVGFHRRIRIYPYPDKIMVGLEDNLHRFEVRIDHESGVVTDLCIKALRYPWTVCADSVGYLREHMVGVKLEELKQLDIKKHCTHLYEMLVLCAAHVNDKTPTQIDLHVDDYHDGCTRVYQFINQEAVLALDVENRVVTTPGEWYGRDLCQPFLWNTALDAAQKEQAMLVCRAIYVSMGRISKVVQCAAERGPRVIGTCFAYQPERVNQAFFTESRREFGQVVECLLADFSPQ